MDLQFISYDKANKTADDDLVVCDCYYPRGLNLVHLYGDRVPKQYLSNTSTEAVLKWLEDPSDHKPGAGAKFATCNHWDIDGFLSLWCAINPILALKNKEILITAAHLGDFREFDPTTDLGLTALKICSLLNAVEAKEFCLPFGDLEDATIEYQVSEQKFEYFLPRFEEWLKNLEAYEFLWRKEYDEVVIDLAYIDNGSAQITEYGEGQISFITTAKPLHYYAIFSRVKGGAILTELADPHYIEFEYPYETIVGRIDKKPFKRKDLSAVARTLTDMEQTTNVRWVFDNINEGGTMLRPESILRPLTREERYQSMCYRSDLLPETSMRGEEVLEMILTTFENKGA